MAEPMRLFDAPATPTLTPRQTAAYQAIVAAGYDGLYTDELGGIVHAFTGRHALGVMCEFCSAAGSELGRALRAKGLVQQRRRRAPGGDTFMVWTVAGKLARAPERDYELPEGY